MELRHLRYFVAVAQTGHFTRAAEQLGISQPPLSQQIQRLEHEVGTPLIKRLTRGIELTETGRTLYKDACEIIKLTDAALERARNVARGISGTVNIGFACSTAFNPAVFSLLHSFRENYPMMHLQPQEKDMSGLMNALEEGNIDFAFIRLPCERSKDFMCRVIDTEEMMVALPRQHPLSRNSAVSLFDLKDESLITFPREVAPSLYDQTIHACEVAGFSPNLGQQSPQLTSAISMVGGGFGMAIVPDSLSKIDEKNVVCLKLKDTRLTSDIAIAWRRGDSSHIILHLLNLL